MREIKFRAWDSEHKEMFLVADIHFNQSFPQSVQSVWPYGRDGFGGRREEARGVGVPGRQSIFLMQFTGLRDKNGREIYEGDILRHRIGGPVCEVRWVRDSVSFFSGGIGKIIEPWNWKESNVIGNIHSNPELLGGPDAKA